MKRIIISIQRISGLASSEAIVILLITALLVTGWVGRALIPQTSAHQEATVQRIMALLDSIERAVEKQPLAPAQSAHSAPEGGFERYPNVRSTRKNLNTAVMVNINTAGKSQLTQLPGIGPAIAERIIESRNDAPFHSVDDLLRVKGIGPAKLERIRRFVTAP
ncbi:MAG: helix-hairpin-helix domain-containing protein [Ignavibacteria bacterium]|nr:helix-hairpin-helix domain-containing protein [Ignavibacteria bacterium]